MVLFKEKYKNEKVINGKLRELLKNSYPEQHRGKIWSFVKILLYKLVNWKSIINK